MSESEGLRVRSPSSFRSFRGLRFGDTLNICMFYPYRGNHKSLTHNTVQSTNMPKRIRSPEGCLANLLQECLKTFLLMIVPLHILCTFAIIAKQENVLESSQNIFAPQM